jgi:FkbM family methyltransferase
MEPKSPEPALSPTARDYAMLGWQTCKRWLVGCHPGFLWTTRRVFLGYPEPELSLLRFLCRRDGLMVDIGASLGMWSFYALPHSKSVISFEPLPPMVSALARGFRGWRARARLESVALSAHQGTTQIVMPRLHPGYSTIEPANDLRDKVSSSFGFESYSVSTRTLDSYGLEDVAFVKIDTEGHEESVLLGGRETLARFRPALVVETEERHKAGAVANVSLFLADLGYRRVFLHDGALRRGEEFSLEKHQDRQRPRDYVRNLIFLQDAHVERLRSAIRHLPFSMAELS